MNDMNAIRRIFQHLRDTYWPLFKSPQTALLLATGLAGFMSARCPIISWQVILGLSGSLFFAISGSTVLNMWYDRDIDSLMQRTCQRPLPAGKLSPRNGLILGIVLSILGVSWAFSLGSLYGLIVFAGLFFDVIIYTILLKRRTAWSIVWGGIAGGMPVLAGRVLATGQIDWIGISLSLAVLFWIPTHILTFNMRNFEDYLAAGIPTFPENYGFRFTNLSVAVSSVIAAVMMGISAYGIGLTWGYLRLMAVLSGGLFFLAAASIVNPSDRVNFGLFKYASLYMLSAMLLLAAEAF
ncbi:MAG: protoheme IX farnesyltransferase [Chloroflexota bacterium]|nr:MAG: protoheme IX farnesyltransferase [Chloroflexota bacterium]